MKKSKLRKNIFKFTLPLLVTSVVVLPFGLTSCGAISNTIFDQNTNNGDVNKLKINLKEKISQINDIITRNVSSLSSSEVIATVETEIKSELTSISGLENIINSVSIKLDETQSKTEVYANVDVIFNENVEFVDNTDLQGYKLEKNILSTTTPLPTLIPKINNIDLSNQELMTKFVDIIQKGLKNISTIDDIQSQQDLIMKSLNEIFGIDAITKTIIAINGHDGVYQTAVIKLTFSNNVILENVDKIIGFTFDGQSMYGGTLTSTNNLLTSIPYSINLKDNLAQIKEIISTNLSFLNTDNNIPIVEQKITNELNSKIVGFEDVVQSTTLDVKIVTGSQYKKADIVIEFKSGLSITGIENLEGFQLHDNLLTSTTPFDTKISSIISLDLQSKIKEIDNKIVEIVQKINNKETITQTESQLVLEINKIVGQEVVKEVSIILDEVSSSNQKAYVFMVFNDFIKLSNEDKLSGYSYHQWKDNDALLKNDAIITSIPKIVDLSSIIKEIDKILKNNFVGVNSEDQIEHGRTKAISELNSISAILDSIQNIDVIINEAAAGKYDTLSVTVTFSDKIAFSNYENMEGYKLFGDKLATITPIETKIPGKTTVDIKANIQEIDSTIYENVSTIQNIDRVPIVENLLVKEINKILGGNPVSKIIISVDENKMASISIIFDKEYTIVNFDESIEYSLEIIDGVSELNRNQKIKTNIK